VIRSKVSPAVSSRTAARICSGVVPLSGSMFSGEPKRSQLSPSGFGP
jgi:hypothetical protein